MILHNFDDWYRIMCNSHYYSPSIKLALEILSARQPDGYMSSPIESVNGRAILARTRKLLSVDEVYNIPGKWYLMHCGYGYHMIDPNTLLLTEGRTQLIRYANLI